MKYSSYLGGYLAFSFDFEVVFFTIDEFVLCLRGLELDSFFFIIQKLIYDQAVSNNFQYWLINLSQIQRSSRGYKFIIKILPSTMTDLSPPQSVNINIYDFIQINPSTILHLFLDQPQSRLYVSRQQYSQIYQISQPDDQPPVLQQIAEFQPSLYFLNIAGVPALFKPFQLKIFRNAKWEHHSFTTQLLSIRVVNNTVYTFHQKEAVAWTFQEDYFTYKYLTQANTPYHLDGQGCISGYGKKVKQINKGANLTKCEVIENEWVLVGDDKGFLHVYEWKFLSHVKTFHEHQAAIMAIKCSSENKTVYFTGSDSKVCVIKLVGNEWQLGEAIRGQSHDIFSLELIGNSMISGGVTTDFCFYPLIRGEFAGDYLHKVSYSCANRTTNEGRFVVVNHRNRFQIWQIGSNLQRTNLIVQYEMPPQKFIIDCKLYRQQLQQKTYLLLVVTDQDTIGWKFSTTHGLVKYITIQNQYLLVQLLPKHIFLGVRSDGLIEKVNCKTGKIQEITYSQIQLPTDLKSLGKGLILIGSKISKTINIASIRSKQILKQFVFKTTFTYVDHLQEDLLLIHYFNTPYLYQFSITEQSQDQLVKLPVALIRFGGWLGGVTKFADKQVKSKTKKYWYGISEGKILIIPNLQKQGTKKIRIKQTERIAHILKPTFKSLSCNLAIIPYNFTRMIDELPLKPIFTKKIV